LIEVVGPRFAWHRGVRQHPLVTVPGFERHSSEVNTPGHLTARGLLE
jgi:hypothetical protein